MAKRGEVSNSDGLEIVSIGALYVGPWDKKYWSSSRGKDRYPFPVGYQARRTHKGLTYTMEIREGSKGPLFLISSNDKQSGSGETPDRAWENFQKKCSSRVKLWHGKRFSGKADGVEFFGFKNAFVQRLLRELVATVNDASEQSAVFTSSSVASDINPDPGFPLPNKCPELMSYLQSNRVTGKRSRSCRGIDTKLDCKNSSGRWQPVDQGDIDEVLCSASRRSNNDKLMISSGSSDYRQTCHLDGPLPVFSDVQLEENDPLSAHGTPVKSHKVCDDSKVEPVLAEGQSELANMEVCTSAPLVTIDLPPEETTLDRQYIDAEGLACPVATEDGNTKAQVTLNMLDSKPPVMMDSEVNHYGVLYAPDTLDTQQEIICPPDSGNHRGEEATARNEVVADTFFSEEPSTGPHSDEGSYLNGDSEKSDYDDIARSMMALLLPKAIPLLTYSSRKKRRKAKTSKHLPSEVKSDDKCKGSNPSTDVISPAGARTNSDNEGKRRTHISGVYSDVAPSKAESIKYIVPDSLDNDQCEDHVANELPPGCDDAEAVAADLQENRELCGKRSSHVLDTIEPFNYHDGPTGGKRIFSNEEPLENFDGRPLKDCVFGGHAAVSSPSSTPSNLLATSKDHCSTADDNSASVEQCSRKTEIGSIYNREDKSHIASARLMSFPVSQQQSSPINALLQTGKSSAPLSESIICRNTGDNCFLETDQEAANLVSPDSCQVKSYDNPDRGKSLLVVEGRLQKQMSMNDEAEEALAQDSSHCIPLDQALICAFNENAAGYAVGNDSIVKNSQASIHDNKIGDHYCEPTYQLPEQRRDNTQNCISLVKEDLADIHKICLPKSECKEEIEDIFKLIGCYSHPTRISSVILTRIAHEIYICVSCGPLEERKRDLFLYKLSSKEPGLGKPFMVGHTSMSLPSLKDEFGREVAIDKSGLQFTPDARGLVLVDSIVMPYCRENNLHCSCPQCESCCFKENAVKIVHIKLGHVSLMLKLNTMHPVHCVLVCEPERLIAVDESGRIYLWIMNSTWSERREEYVLPSYDFLPSRVIELKRVPHSASMVIGHNGYGDFSLWDIIKRTVVSRFSAPASSVLEYLPVSMFNWQHKYQSYAKMVTEECVRKNVEASKMWFSRSEANNSCSMEGEEIAVWLLLYTSSNSSVQSTCFVSNNHLNTEGCWRLGLLAKNTVILGAALPPSTAALGTSAGIGIFGSYKGHVDIWDLATGARHGNLHDFAGNGVSHIVVDAATSSTVAIAHDGGQLRVYVHH